MATNLRLICVTRTLASRQRSLFVSDRRSVRGESIGHSGGNLERRLKPGNIGAITAPAVHSTDSGIAFFRGKTGTSSITRGVFDVPPRAAPRDGIEVGSVPGTWIRGRGGTGPTAHSCSSRTYAQTVFPQLSGVHASDRGRRGTPNCYRWGQVLTSRSGPGTTRRFIGRKKHTAGIRQSWNALNRGGTAGHLWIGRPMARNLSANGPSLRGTNLNQSRFVARRSRYLPCPISRRGVGNLYLVPGPTMGSDGRGPPTLPAHEGFSTARA